MLTISLASRCWMIGKNGGDAHISLSGSPPRSLLLVQSLMHVSFYLGAVKPNIRQDAVVEGLQVSDMASNAQVQRLALARSLELSLPQGASQHQERHGSTLPVRSKPGE